MKGTKTQNFRAFRVVRSCKWLWIRRGVPFHCGINVLAESGQLDLFASNLAERIHFGDKAGLSGIQKDMRFRTHGFNDFNLCTNARQIRILFSHLGANIFRTQSKGDVGHFGSCNFFFLGGVFEFDLESSFAEEDLAVFFKDSPWEEVHWRGTYEAGDKFIIGEVIEGNRVCNLLDDAVLITQIRSPWSSPRPGHG